MAVGATEPGAANDSRRGPYRNGIRRRDEIVEAAIEVFAEFGYAGGSIRTIAARVGVSPATLLSHFGSKEGLLMAVLEEWSRRTTAASLEGSSGVAYFRRFPEVMQFHLDNRGLLELFTTLAADASSPSHPARTFIQRRYLESMGTLCLQLARAVADGEIPPLSRAQIEREARLLTAMLDGIGLQWLLDPSTDLVGDVTAFIDDTIARWQQPHPGT
jgi:AcrR family transcriptional regulator